MELLFPCENQRDTRRLLLLVPWLGMGGADKFNLDLLAQLTQRGWEVLIATTLQGDHSWLPRFARFASDIFVLPRSVRLGEYPRSLRDLINARQVPVVLIANSEVGYLLLPYLRAQCPAVTFLDFCHMEEEAWKKGGYPRMAVDHQELLDLHVVSSGYLRDWMVQQGADAQRVRVCYTNVDPLWWRPDLPRRIAVRQEFGIDDTVPVILYAGRICAQKQPRVFAETLRRLVRQDVDFAALVAGDGPEFEWLRARVEGAALKARVRLLGTVSNERVQELMAAADVFFLPSQWEGIALSMYEAMACGLPVVGADVGGQRELVTPECGVLVARSDEETEVGHYAEALATLLRNPQRRREMGQVGSERVRTHFRLDQMGERMTTLLYEAMRLHVAQPRPVPDRDWGRARATRMVTYMQAQAVVRRFLSPSARAMLDKNKRWLLPLKETVERMWFR